MISSLGVTLSGATPPDTPPDRQTPPAMDITTGPLLSGWELRAAGLEGVAGAERWARGTQPIAQNPALPSRSGSRTRVSCGQCIAVCEIGVGGR